MDATPNQRDTPGQSPLAGIYLTFEQKKFE